MTPYKLSELMVVQNMFGYDRIESSNSLDQDTVHKEKLGIHSYPDPETLGVPHQTAIIGSFVNNCLIIFEYSSITHKGMIADASQNIIAILAFLPIVP